MFIARWPYAACILWVIGSPYAKYFLDFKLGKGIPMLTFDSVVIPFLAFVLILRTFRHRRRLGRFAPGEVFYLAFVVYVFLCTFFRWQMTMSNLRNFVLYSFGFWAITYYVFKAAIRNREQVVGIMVALVCAGSIAGLTFMYEAFTHKSFYSVVTGQSIALRLYGGMGRSSGVFIVPVEPGHMLATAAVLALHFVAYARKRSTKVLSALAVLICSAGAYYTYTRVNWAGLFIAMFVVMFLARGRSRFFRTVVPLATATAVCVGILAMSNPMVQHRMTVDTLSHRGVFMLTALNVIRHNPWFGVGWLNAPEATQEYMVSRVQYEGHRNEVGLPMPTLVHNTFLQITQEHGIFGAILYYGTFLMFLISAFRLWTRVPANDILGKDFVAVLIASIIVWIASSQTSDNSAFLYANGVCMLVFAMITRLGYIWQTDEQAVASSPTEALQTGNTLVAAR